METCIRSMPRGDLGDKKSFRNLGPQRQPETIALDEYNKGDSLRRIHAQSSADTSGLGDSLQLIHAFSSTETSGYWDWEAGCGGSPSPETQHTPRQESPGKMRGGRLGCQENRGSPGRRIAGLERGDSNQWPSGLEQSPSVRGESGGGEEEEGGGGGSGVQAGRGFSVQIDRPTSVHTDTLHTAILSSVHSENTQTARSSVHTDDIYKADISSSVHTDTPKETSEQHTDTQITHSSNNMPQRRKSDDTPTKMPRPHSMDAEVNAITSGHYGNFLDHRDLPPGLRRSESETSVRSMNYFFGKEMSSTWLKWSQDRRVSFKRRMKEMEVRQRELEEQRMTTPVRKARIESVKFVSYELEGGHVPEDEDLQVHERLQSYMPPPKSRKREEKEEVKLSTHHWVALVRFWEHPLFIRCRVGGILLGSLALMITIISLTNQNWSYYKDHTFYGASYSGLWLICSSNWHGNCTSTFNRDWQYAVIGLLIFTVAFGFLATMLAICGICTTSLPRKLYYYHSAGEIYLICAVSILAAVLIYPLAIRAELQNNTHQHGLGFTLAWVAIFVFVGSALCMCLDEIMRAATKFWQACEDHTDMRV